MSPPIGIFFSTSQHLVSKAIRLVTRSRVSHAGIIYYDESLAIPVVMHATGVGFHILPLKKFLKDNLIIASYTSRHEGRLAMGLHQVARRLGDHYDFEGVLGFLLVYIGRWLHKKWRNPFRDSGRMFCSEMVVVMLQDAAFFSDLDPETTSPEDLMQRLNSSPEFQILDLQGQYRKNLMKRGATGGEGGSRTPKAG